MHGPACKPASIPEPGDRDPSTARRPSRTIILMSDTAHLRSKARNLALPALLVALLFGTCLLPGPASPQSAQQQQRQQAGERPVDPDRRAAGGERASNDDGIQVSGATLMLTPSRQRLAPGDHAVLSLSILGADDLRRLPATVRYDARVVELSSVRLGSAWDDRPTPILLHDANREGEVVIGLALLDRDLPGVFGTAELLELEFIAVAPGEASLRIEDFAVISADSRARPAATAAAAIIVQ